MIQGQAVTRSWPPSKAVSGVDWDSVPGLGSTSDKRVCFYLLVCFSLFCFGGGEGRSRRGESPRPLSPCSRVQKELATRPKDGVQPSSLLCQSRPELSTFPPTKAGLALHEAASRPCLISRRLLSAHPSVDKWPAGWLLVTPAWRGALLSGLCLAIWAGAQGGGSHSGGGLAQHHPWGFQPQNDAAWTFHSRDRNPGLAAHPVPPPSLIWLYSSPYNVGKGWCYSH